METHQRQKRKLPMMSCQQIVTSLFFPIYEQFAATRKPDSGRRVYETYIFINSDLLSYKT